MNPIVINAPGANININAGVNDAGITTTSNKEPSPYFLRPIPTGYSSCLTPRRNLDRFIVTANRLNFLFFTQ